jgi:hypothetical protein
MFQEVEISRFQDNPHTKVVRLSAIYTGRLYPQDVFLVLVSVRAGLSNLQPSLKIFVSLRHLNSFSNTV